MKFELEPDNKSVKDEELINDLKRVASRLNTDSLTQKEYKKYGKYGVTIFWSRFSGWSKVLAKAGLKNGKSRPAFFIKDAELIEDLKRVSFELKNDSLTKEEYNRRGRFHSATQEARFGTWVKAKEKAGLKRRAHPSISDEEYFTNLEEVWIKLGRQPHFRDMQIPFSKYSGSGYVANFGTWRKALTRFVEYINQKDGTIAEEVSLEEDQKLYETSTIEHSKEGATSVSVVKIAPAKRHKTERVTQRCPNHRLRFKVMKRDNFKCRGCGRSPATDPTVVLHVDHIKAWANGGETVLENLQTLCSVCNIGKSDLE